MTVDTGAGGKFVVFHDSVGVEPMDEIFLDGVAFGVMADGASAGVARRIGRRRFAGARAVYLII